MFSPVKMYVPKDFSVLHRFIMIIIRCRETFPYKSLTFLSFYQGSYTFDIIITAISTNDRILLFGPLIVFNYVSVIIYQTTVLLTINMIKRKCIIILKEISLIWFSHGLLPV